MDQHPDPHLVFWLDPDPLKTDADPKHCLRDIFFRNTGGCFWILKQSKKSALITVLKVNLVFSEGDEFRRIGMVSRV
jgi:hypothetical protein